MSGSRIVACAALCLSAAVGVSPGIADPAEAAGQGPPPNVVLIVTDDQAEGTLDAMPRVRSELRNKGMAIRHGVIPTSTCCPSRTTLLTGQYSRTTGVYRNTGDHGGWPVFNSAGSEDGALPVALQSSGYRTGLFGKYLNGFALADQGYVPPGWDDFLAIYDPSSTPKLAAGAYYNYELRGTREFGPFGQRPSDYSTDVIAGQAVRFVESTPTNKPLFLYFAPTGAHAPFTAAPRHQELWHKEPLDPAALQLTSGRPSFMPDKLVPRRKMILALQSQHEALMAVDEAVGSIIDALGDRAQNTLFVLVSDNGLQFGEHGLTKKYSPYSGSTDVPMILRWDGVIDAQSTYKSLVTNADLAVTVAEAAGVELSRPDGVSVFSTDRPDAVALEAMGNEEHPAYCGVRTRRYMYVQYANGERELYDYRTDPHELTNAADTETYAEVQTELHASAKDMCTPTPPGFSW